MTEEEVVLGWFFKPVKASAEASGSTRSKIRRTVSANIELDVAALDAIGYVHVHVHVGDAFSFVHEGWWLLATPDGAVGLNVECPMIDVVLRDGALQDAADCVSSKFVLDLPSRPRQFRGDVSADGVALLTAFELRTLRDHGVEAAVASVRDFPIVL